MTSDDEEVCDYFYDDDDAEEDAAAGLEEDSSPTPEGRADYWAITQETVFAAQKQDLSTVMNLLNIKQHQARALLIHHRWRMDGIYDSLDMGRERMLRNAGIVLQENNGVAAAGSMTPWRTVTCKVCFEDFSMDAVSTMDCGHCFCNGLSGDRHPESQRHSRGVLLRGATDARRGLVEIGKQLLRGAVDLEESLSMLMMLQDATDYMEMGKTVAQSDCQADGARKPSISEDGCRAQGDSEVCET